jgi:hypothetical protein
MPLSTPLRKCAFAQERRLVHAAPVSALCVGGHLVTTHGIRLIYLESRIAVLSLLMLTLLYVKRADGCQTVENI